MFEVGTRIVHKDSPNTFANSWEVMSVTDGIVMGLRRVGRRIQHTSTRA